MRKIVQNTGYRLTIGLLTVVAVVALWVFTAQAHHEPPSQAHHEWPVQVHHEGPDPVHHEGPIQAH